MELKKTYHESGCSKVGSCRIGPSKKIKYIGNDWLILKYIRSIWVGFEKKKLEPREAARVRSDSVRFGALRESEPSQIFSFFGATSRAEPFWLAICRKLINLYNNDDTIMMDI